MAKGSKKKRPSGRRPTPAKRQPAPKRAAAGTPGASPPSGKPSTAAPAATTTDGGAGSTRAPAPPRPDGKTKPTRTERLDAARRARKRKALLTRVAIVGTVAVIAAVIAFAVAADRRADRAERERLTAGSCTFDTDHDDLSAPPNNHVAPASYEVDPPSGGNHDPQPAPPGLYGEGGQPPPSDAKLVHSLEHGYVILWHRPDLEEKDITAIRGVFDDNADDVLVVPRPTLQQKVAATSWQKRLLCGEVEPDRLAEFIRLYKNDSPEPRS